MSTFWHAYNQQHLKHNLQGVESETTVAEINKIVKNRIAHPASIVFYCEHLLSSNNSVNLAIAGQGSQQVVQGSPVVLELDPQVVLQGSEGIG